MATLYCVTVRDWQTNSNYTLGITAADELEARTKANDWLNPKHDDKVIRVEPICTTNDEVNREL